MYSCRTVRLQCGESERKAVIRDAFGVDHRGVTSLSAPIGTDLVPWTGALQRFSSCDGSFIVGSALEKHLSLDGDFTPDQEKVITFKRWPPGTKAENLAWHATG